jgi:hypothetical protein
MVPTLQLPQEASRLWADPAIRAKIVAMHRDEVPLLDMIDALDLTSILDADGLRGVIEGLSSAEIATIRDAFVAEALAAEGVGAHFPIDCRVDNVAVGVEIVAAEGQRDAVGPIARILPVSSG